MRQSALNSNYPVRRIRYTAIAIKLAAVAKGSRSISLIQYNHGISVPDVTLGVGSHTSSLGSLVCSCNGLAPCV
jgi:hypothetical protein